MNVAALNGLCSIAVRWNFSVLWQRLCEIVDSNFSIPARTMSLCCVLMKRHSVHITFCIITNIDIVEHTECVIYTFNSTRSQIVFTQVRQAKEART